MKDYFDAGMLLNAGHLIEITNPTNNFLIFGNM